MEQILTVLAGQPNCGKSTIFNMLTGARQYVANYPGVTVEKKAGSFVCGDTRVELVDLPGTYSLASWSPEEMAARQFIVEEDPAQIVAVLDASTLEKSLYLCLQLLEMRRPTLAVLNMMDVAAKRGIRVDADALPRRWASRSSGPRPARGSGSRNCTAPSPRVTAVPAARRSSITASWKRIFKKSRACCPGKGSRAILPAGLPSSCWSRTALPRGCSLPWIRKTAASPP